MTTQHYLTTTCPRCKKEVVVPDYARSNPITFRCPHGCGGAITYDPKTSKPTISQLPSDNGHVAGVETPAPPVPTPAPVPTPGPKPMAFAPVSTASKTTSPVASRYGVPWKRYRKEIKADVKNLGWEKAKVLWVGRGITPSTFAIMTKALGVLALPQPKVKNSDAVVLGHFGGMKASENAASRLAGEEQGEVKADIAPTPKATGEQRGETPSSAHLPGTLGERIKDMAEGWEESVQDERSEHTNAPNSMSLEKYRDETKRLLQFSEVIENVMEDDLASVHQYVEALKVVLEHVEWLLENEVKGLGGW